MGLAGGMAWVGARQTVAPASIYVQKVSAEVRETFARDNTAAQNIVIVLKKQADLSGAIELKSKSEKGAFVYQALTAVAQETQPAVVKILEDKNLKFQRFYITNMIFAKKVNEETVKALAEREDVGRIITNPQVALAVQPRTPGLVGIRTAGIEKNISYVNAPKVWSEFGAKGQGIVVAGQDTGVQWDHPALINQYRGYNGETKAVDHAFQWHDAIHEQINSGSNSCGYGVAIPCDDDQHGTHTIGTVVGDDGKGNQIGMAPDAKWMACRNMDAGLGAPTTYLECFEFFLAPFAHGTDPMTAGNPELSPHVINNSWGCPESEGCEGSEMLEAMGAMKAAGIAVVVSAGNEGSTCKSIGAQPATLSGSVFSVGAMSYTSGKIASFSSRGPSALTGMLGPDVAAPGVSIRSAVPGGGYAGGWNGTSMAGPHVAGLVALLWSAVPELVGKVDATFNIIRLSATPVKTLENCGGVSGQAIPNNTYGYGNIDAYNAVVLAKQIGTLPAE